MDEQKLAQVEKEVGRLDLSDHILAVDRKQGRDRRDGQSGKPASDQRVCKHDEDHGLLSMHASGTVLICAVSRPQPCGYNEPVSRG